jgi:beta-aspartyl-peptidase (threonine type)
MFVKMMWSFTLVLMASQFACCQDGAEPDADAGLKYAIVIHGGAGSSPKRFSDEANAARKASMQKALEIGTEILKSGGSSLDAVEKVINFLEDDPQFNAGVGAVYNAEGSHELDASIMDGSQKACGAVAGVSTVKNPISLARKVMTETRHVLLAGQGAEQFAKEMQVELVEPSHFDTPRSHKRWDERQKRMQELKKKVGALEALEQIKIVDEDVGSYQGTVGCVALDSNGNIAAATSTGGMTAKKFGRVGDSPIVGAGTYADNETCGVSCTGIGEQYIRNAIAYDVSARMKYKGQTVEEAVQAILTETLNAGDGGIIAISKDGEISMGFNTDGMARAAADSNGRFEVLWDE